MDQSITRRGQPCWYLKEGIGNIAINDSFILESCIYKILKKHLKDHTQYLDMIELFHEVTFQTELGQLMDLTTSTPSADIFSFNMERYKFIVLYKTAFYSFYLPVTLAFLLAGINDERLFQQSKNILLPLGEFFQIQDDFLDCFGDPLVIGKIGTDIQDNKCSWLLVTALGVVDEFSKAKLKENYGRKDQQSVNAVKEIYRKFGLPELYQKLEKRKSEEISSLINQIDIKYQEIYSSFARKIFGRSK